MRRWFLRQVMQQNNLISFTPTINQKSHRYDMTVKVLLSLCGLSFPFYMWPRIRGLYDVLENNFWTQGREDSINLWNDLGCSSRNISNLVKMPLQDRIKLISLVKGCLERFWMEGYSFFFWFMRFLFPEDQWGEGYTELETGKIRCFGSKTARKFFWVPAAGSDWGVWFVWCYSSIQIPCVMETFAL